jgi:hypothetical protein
MPSWRDAQFMIKKRNIPTVYGFGIQKIYRKKTKFCSFFTLFKNNCSCLKLVLVGCQYSDLDQKGD